MKTLLAGSHRLLADLRPGEAGTITRVGGAAEIRNRLLEMGLTQGTPVRVVRAAPFGDPIELFVRGYRLSVRKSEVSAVSVGAV